MRHSAKHGFTLLEIIITITVVALLAATAIPTLNLIQERSLLSSLESEADAIARNANALAFSRSGADVSPETLQDSVNEAYETNPPTVAGGEVTLVKQSGSRVCALVLAVVNGKAVRGEAICATDGTTPSPTAPS